MEADSLNYSMLGPDAAPGTPEFDLFIKEVVREMTVKAGQKCTAIRRTFVPESMVQRRDGRARPSALRTVTIGDPAVDGVRMGPLAGRGQVGEVRKSVDAIARVDGARVRQRRRLRRRRRGSRARRILSDAAVLLEGSVRRVGAARRRGVRSGEHRHAVHVRSTKRSRWRRRGRAVSSARCSRQTTASRATSCSAPRRITAGCCSPTAHSAKESTGHGSPLPHLVHGGPGRAGGGEEMGGVRGVMHYMQRTALQGSPTTLMHVTNEYTPGAERTYDRVHPFRKYFDELEVGDVARHRRGAR